MLEEVPFDPLQILLGKMDVPPIRDHCNRQLSPAMVYLLTKALSTRPDDRYADADAMRSDLAKCGSHPGAAGSARGQSLAAFKEGRAEVKKSLKQDDSVLVDSLQYNPPAKADNKVITDFADVSRTNRPTFSVRVCWLVVGAVC